MSGIIKVLQLSKSFESKEHRIRSFLIGLPAGYPELAPLSVEIPIVVAFGILSPIFGCVIYGIALRSARRQGNLGEY